MADTYFWRGYKVGTSPPSFVSTSLLSDGTEPDHSTRASGNVGSEDVTWLSGDSGLIEDFYVDFGGRELIITSIRFSTKATRLSPSSAGVSYSIYVIDIFGTWNQIATGGVSNNGFSDVSLSTAFPAFGVAINLFTLVASLPPVTGLSAFDLRYDGYPPFGSNAEGFTRYWGPFGSASQGFGITVPRAGSISHGFQFSSGVAGSVVSGFGRVGGGGSVVGSFNLSGSGGSISSSFSGGTNFGSTSGGFVRAGNAGSVAEGFSFPTNYMGSVSQGYTIIGSGGSVSQGFTNPVPTAGSVSEGYSPTGAVEVIVNFFPLFSV